MMNATQQWEQISGRPAPEPQPRRRREDTLAKEVDLDLALTAAWLEAYEVLHRGDDSAHIGNAVDRLRRFVFTVSWLAMRLVLVALSL